MIDKNYRDSALKVYGNRCEICGFGIVEVHHIDYQEQWEMEKRIRNCKDAEFKQILLKEAKVKGYDEFKGNQLSKNDDTKNLSCLCCNCHSMVHLLDSGKKLLNILPERK